MWLGEWNARLEYAIGTINWKLYLYRKINNGIEFVTSSGEVITTNLDGQAPASADPYFAMLEDDQLKVIADAFSSKGIKTDSDHKIEGSLEATRAHLEDMRVIALSKYRDK